MTKYLFIFLLAVSLGVAAFSNRGLAQENGPQYGIVDLTRLMRDSDPGKAGIKFIEDEQSKMQKQLDTIQKNLEKNPTDQALMQQLQTTYSALQQKIQTDGQQVATQIYDTIIKVLDKYRADKGYKMIIGNEAVPSFDTALDITDAVMAEINKEKVEFKSSPLPEIPAPATPPADKPKENDKKESTPPAK